MSYILDALKKSEQERGKGNIPGVQTVHSSSLLYRKEKKAWWPYILTAAVLLNLVVISYFFYHHRSPLSSNLPAAATPVANTQPQQALAAATAPVTTPAHTITAQPQNAAPQTDNSRNAKTETTTKTLRAKQGRPPSVRQNREMQTTAPPADHTTSWQTDTATPSSRNQTDKQENNSVSNSSAKKTDIPEQFELPDDVQRRLPTLVISAHVYSSKPQQRSMVINNQFLEEGDYILDGLILEEITPDGAIFNYNGLRFHNGVVSSWQ